MSIREGRFEFKDPNGLDRKCFKLTGLRFNKDGNPFPFLIFDFDGTLCDSLSIYWKAVCSFVLQKGGNVGGVPSKALFRSGTVHLSSEFFYDLGMPREMDHDMVWEEFTICLNRIRAEDGHRFVLFEGMKQTVKELNDFFDILIVTNNSIDPIGEIIEEQVGIKAHVIRVSHKQKALARIAKRHADYHQTSCLFFGDSLTDMKCGATAGEYRIIKNRKLHSTIPLVLPIGVVSESGTGDQEIDQRLPGLLMEAGAVKVLSHLDVFDFAFKHYEKTSLVPV